MSAERLPLAALASFVGGLLLVLLIDAGIARVVGIPMIFVGIGLGVAAIATPAFLERDRDEL